ncbi:tail fiber domain-containing protein [Bradyrhizobium diazoefficiens]|uniref:tail fiber domain-containing protein n=1 Tax=Bradyrhizobium diazoefficiens TaxID=1355477 RepID=UPI001FDFFD91|nr:tail fiber domain-containing protein [Bradyrhizobium diazoefficiens]
MLQGILGQINGLLPSTGLNTAQSGAINQLTQNGQAGNPYAPQVGNVASTLLNGGGATNQAGAVNQAYQQYYNATNPLASNTNYNPYDTPGFKQALDTMIADTTNSVNGSFAAAGRDFSGMNSQTLGRGIAQGVAPTIAAQYNQNVQNQQGAAGNLYNAGNTTAGLQTGLTQQDLANRTQGVATANDALTAQNWGPNQVLQAQQYLQSIPQANLAGLAQIGIPIAGLGSQSSGTSNTTNQMSGAQQFATILQGLGSLMPKGPMNLNFGG